MKRPNQDDLQAQRLVDGLLSGSERASFEERLETEPALAALVAELRSIRVLLSGPVQGSPAPPGFAQRLWRLHQVSRADSEGAVGLLRRLAVAASLLLLLGLGSLAWLHTTRGGRVLQGDDLEHRYQELLREARARKLLLPRKEEPKDEIVEQAAVEESR